jgi:DNA sulfur modification protein DndD
MLDIQSITLYNFGPFKGEHKIAFNQEGVCIIYGENMRGKTSLLNAIRYAFFGKVLGRGSRTVELHKIGNWESSAAGEYGFKVSLNFSSEDHEYELTRTFSPKRGILRPTEDKDYVQDVYLKKNGNVLGPEITKNELMKIMPEQVSRFFLFDGELLQEYEELLIKESEAGQKIADAIERILGVPVLTNGRADLRELFQKAQKNESKAAQKDQKTRELGIHIEDLTNQIGLKRMEITKFESDLNDLKDTKNGLERQIKKNAKADALIIERDQKEKEQLLIKNKLTERYEKLKDMMETAWIGLLYPILSVVQDKIQAKVDDLTEVKISASSQKQLNEIYQNAINSMQCPICTQALTAQHRENIHKLIYVEEKNFDEDEYGQLILSLKLLKQFVNNSKNELLLEHLNAIDDLIVQRTTKADRLAEIKEQIGKIDEEDVVSVRVEYETTIKEIGLLEDQIKRLKTDLKNDEDNLSKMQSLLDKLAGADLEKERRLRELYYDLMNLFHEGVGYYRDLLRKRVEKNASELFVKLTSEPEYRALQINDNYGLTIMHNDGSLIPLRSSGAEHIVALSLMGALQRNAPLQGPIIMDSPFGRLDDTHTSNIVKALPDMANQTILLVYKSELPPNIARKLLGGKLRNEYYINRISAKHTEIRPYYED